MITYQEFRKNIVSLVEDLDTIANAKFEALDLNKALIYISEKYDLAMEDLNNINFTTA